jgi:hypothetical protein
MLRIKRLWAIAFAGVLALSILSAPSAPALAFKQIPATNWGYTYAGTTPTSPSVAKSVPAKNLEAKSKFIVKYNNFPDWAKKEV